MDNLFEQSDILNAPVEAFIFDSAREEFPVRAHWHYFMEIILMISGQAEVVSGEQSRRLSAGELALFHPKAIHSISADEGEAPVYYVLKFDISRLRATAEYAPRLRDIFYAAQSDPHAAIFLTAEQCASINAQAMAGECVTEAFGQGYSYGTVLDALLHSLLTRIIRLWAAAGFAVDRVRGSESGEAPIYSISEYIDAHSSEDLRVSDLAELCGMSYSHFERRFKAIYRQSCKSFISRVRVNKAADYLLFTGADLSYISQETGFSDCSHFIRTFRELRGVTPGRFRAAHRSGEGD